MTARTPQTRRPRGCARRRAAGAWLVRAALALLAGIPALAAAQPAAPASAPASHDAALAARLGADARGMRPYVLVILRSGPSRVPDGPEREAMFRGHFANMKRLADAGQLAFAGPLDGVEGRRGIFIYAVATVDEARTLTASDPVIERGEMVAEYHRLYGSAALMLVREVHDRLARPPG